MHGVAGGFHVAKQFIGFLNGIGHLPHHRPFAQRGEQTFLGARIPQALEVETDLAAGNMQADVARGHAVQMLRLVKNRKVITKYQALTGIFLLVHVSGQPEREVGEKQRVIEHEHIGGEKTAARFLEKTLAVQRGGFTAAPAKLRRTQAALGRHSLPHLGIRFHVEIRQRAVFRFLGPRFHAF